MKNYRIPALVLSALGVASAQSVTAGQVTGTVEIIQAGHGYTPDNAYVLITINGTPSSQPACATDPRFAINPATAAGKTMLALLTAAKAAGTPVWLMGTNDCSLMGSAHETVSYMRAL